MKLSMINYLNLFLVSAIVFITIQGTVTSILVIHKSTTLILGTIILWGSVYWYCLYYNFMIFFINDQLKNQCFDLSKVNNICVRQENLRSSGQKYHISMLKKKIRKFTIIHNKNILLVFVFKKFVTFLTLLFPPLGSFQTQNQCQCIVLFIDLLIHWNIGHNLMIKIVSIRQNFLAIKYFWV